MSRKSRSAKYKSLDDVKNKLNVTHFSALPADKRNQLFSMMLDIDPAVVSQILSMLPDAVNSYKEAVSKLIEIDREENLGFQGACQSIIDEYLESLKDGKLDHEERREIRGKIESILDRMQEERARTREHHINIMKIIGSVLATVVAGVVLTVTKGRIRIGPFR